MTVFRLFSLLTSFYLLLFIVDVNTFQLSSRWFSDQINSELLEEEDAEGKTKLEGDEKEFCSASCSLSYISFSEVWNAKIGNSPKIWASQTDIQFFSPPPEA